MTGKLDMSCLFGLLLSVAFGVARLRAAMPDSSETWDGGAIQGWRGRDPLNAAACALDNPTNFLRVVFGRQSPSLPEVRIVQADAGSSDGKFAADYRGAGVTNVSFRLYCPTHTPADLRLYIHNAANDRWWHVLLPAPAIGQWTSYGVSLDYASGWRLGIGGTPHQFADDLKSVDWIGVQIQRDKSPEAQEYGLDDFVIRSAYRTVDSDKDGMNDWAEFLAGTNPNDPNSALLAEIGVTNTTDGIVLRWRSSAHRTYALPRSTNLAEGFNTKVAAGIPATPPVNVYVDNTATNSKAYFYRIEVEE